MEGTEVSLGFSQPVLRGDFSIPTGVTAVLGPNGAGKTTLLNALQGLTAPLAGEIRLLGRPIAHYSPRDLARTLALVPQELPTAVHQSVRDVITLGLLGEVGWWKAYPSDTSQRVNSVLEALALTGLKARPVETLSTGERQKVFLGQALVRRPQLLLLDEPTSHLDPGATERFWESLPSVPTVVVSHDLGFAKKHSDWVLAVRDGKFDYCGKSTEFFETRDPKALYR